jgi:hypothetical protein
MVFEFLKIFVNNNAAFAIRAGNLLNYSNQFFQNDALLLRKWINLAILCLNPISFNVA